jgi:hypothetical protein
MCTGCIYVHEHMFLYTDTQLTLSRKSKIPSFMFIFSLKQNLKFLFPLTLNQAAI